MKYLAFLATFLLAALLASEPAPYPTGFRNWVHVKSALVTAAHPAAQTEGGIHHVYANPKAAEAYPSGQFPDGAVIVYELLQTTENGGVISEGARRRLDVMVKDSERYKATGGWGFHRFMGSEQTGDAVADAGKAMCFDCHAAAAAHGFVFSRIR
jgi:hypothetical protein